MRLTYTDLTLGDIVEMQVKNKMKIKQILHIYHGTIPKPSRKTEEKGEWGKGDTLNTQIYTFNTQIYTFNTQIYTFNTQIYTFNTQIYTFSTQIYTFNTQIYTFSTPIYDRLFSILGTDTSIKSGRGLSSFIGGPYRQHIITVDNCGFVIGCLFTSNHLDHGFDPLLGQTENYQIGIAAFAPYIKE